MNSHQSWDSLRVGCFCIAISSGLFAGCSAGTGSDSPGSGGSGGSGATGTGTGVTGATGSMGAFMTSSTSTGSAMEIAEVFGHSATTLYKLDPVTKAVTTVGDFSGCEDQGGFSGQVIDIALDKDSKIIATTFGGLFHVDKTTAVCTLIQYGNYPNSLSFVPAGTLDPNAEALVGYQGDQYVRIDPTSGNITPVGSPWNNGLLSSGDVVSVKGGKSYLTVDGTGCADCIVEIDPASGAMVKNWGPLSFTEVWGIAFWAGSVYGFTNGGQLFEVSFPNGVLMTKPIAAPGGVSFWGAGSTTSAPPVPTAQ